MYLNLSPSLSIVSSRFVNSEDFCHQCCNSNGQTEALLHIFNVLQSSRTNHKWVIVTFN